MSSIDEIRNARIKKLKLLRDKGMNPYPAESKRELTLKTAVDNFNDLEKNKEEKWIAGRIMSIRGQGAIIFITLFDGTGSFQGLLKKDIIGDEKFNFWNEVADIGDFVEMRGSFFKTNRGEKTLEAKDWRMLSKSLRPLPEKWHGLTDIETRYRQRYLDLIVNPEVKNVFIKRFKIINSLRNSLNEKGYIEVDTPVLQPMYGGANARPFKSHLHDLKMEVYLRISNELYLKRLLVGGFEKVYEIARDFRNESIDSTHNPEFSMIEIYQAYSDYKDIMELTQEIILKALKNIQKGTKVNYRGSEIDFKLPWEKMTMKDAVKKKFKDEVEISQDKRTKSAA